MKEGKPIFSPPSSPISDCSQPSSLYKEDASHKSECNVIIQLNRHQLGLFTDPDLGQTHNEDVIPSSQFSDMELTCHNSDQVIDVNGTLFYNFFLFYCLPIYNRLTNQSA